MAKNEEEDETPDPARFAWGKDDIVVTRRASDGKKDDSKKS